MAPFDSNKITHCNWIQSIYAQSIYMPVSELENNHVTLTTSQDTTQIENQYYNKIELI